jgi:UDP-2,3-diacylglucosamine pyrophosphatase LpxH
MPTNLPPNTPLYVLSDLHLAPRGDLLGFHAHTALVSLLEHLTSQPHPVRLVLNGDVFDFLQLPDYTDLSLPLAPVRMSQILDALDSEAPASNIVQALRRFTNKGHQLHCIAGNHDPELNLHAVQAVLATRLGSTNDIPFKQGCWSLNVGQHTVLAMHGHWRDPFNAISAESLHQAQANGDACAPLPPGSRLVLNVLNPYRRALTAEGAKRFPFIDLLPSEMAVLYALLYLDPQLAMRRINAALNISVSALLRKVHLYLNPSRLLTLDKASTNQATLAATNDHVLDHIAQGLVMCLNEQERIPANSAMLTQQIDNYLQARPSVGGQGMLLSQTAWVRGLLLRGIGQELVKARNAFEPAVPDALAEHSICTWGHQASGPIIALTGHTHAAKQIKHLAGVYLNSGTWQDLVHPPEDTSEDGVQAWLQALQANQVPRWQRCPVVRVNDNGAALLSWNGDSLQSWAVKT